MPLATIQYRDSRPLPTLSHHFPTRAPTAQDLLPASPKTQPSDPRLAWISLDPRPEK